MSIPSSRGRAAAYSIISALFFALMLSSVPADAAGRADSDPSVADFASDVGFMLLADDAFSAPQPIVKLSPTSLNFGTVEVGRTTMAQTVTVTNAGNSTLDITSIGLEDVDNYLRFNSCPTTLPAGSSCNFAIAFAPQSVGDLSSRVQVHDSVGVQKIPITAISVAPSVLLSPNTVNFGTVAEGNTSAPETVTLTNQGTSTLLSIGVTVSGGGYTLATNNCPASLAAQGSCSFSVTYSPGGGGTAMGTVTVTDSDPSSPQFVGLIGTGTSGAVTLNPPSLTFNQEPVGTKSAPQTVTVTNSGATPLAMISILASGDYAQTNNCPGSLAASANCTIHVTFTPSAKGTRAGYITLNDTDPTNLQTVTLTGSGVMKPSIVTISPRQASVTFSQTQQFTGFISGSQADVTWSVDQIAGGNSRVGTITTSGLYTPPQTAGSHVITAQDPSEPSQTANAPLVVTNFPGAFTYGYDNSRDGQNTQETVLTTGNVNATQFGKLFRYPVDGEIYPDPLYVPNVNIPSQGTHNVVYVATEADSVYAFDADGRTSTALWHTNFTDPDQGVTTVPYADVLPTSCRNTGPVLGITGTPVIDPVRGVLYVMVRTKEVTNGVATYPQRLHALDITTGAEVAGSPATVDASVPGIGEGNNGQGQVPFDDIHDNSRAGLLLVNGVVYVTWSSPCDQHPYHGWVIGFDESTLQQVYVFNTTPNGDAGSIWGAGAGPAADSEGNIYFLTGNGDFNADVSGGDYGIAMVKLSGANPEVLDYFAPYNSSYLAFIDFDLASGNVLLLPDQTVGPPHLAIGTGKEGTIYLVNRDNMGHFSATDNNQIVQWLFKAVGNKTGVSEAYFGLPAYWQNNLYFWGANDVFKMFRFYNGLMSRAPIVTGTLEVITQGPTPAISSNGNAQGIMWTVEWLANKAAILRAYDAANPSREIYDSTQAGKRDTAGISVEYTVPMVANGKVYVATEQELDVYGLLP